MNEKRTTKENIKLCLKIDCAEFRYMKKEKKMKNRKKGIRWRPLLALLVLLFCGVVSNSLNVQAAENVNYLDFKTSNGLWDINRQWTSVNENANLTKVESSGLSQKADTGSLIYLEAPGILGYPDTSSWIKVTYDNIGTIGGRSVSAQVYFQRFYGKKDTHALGAEWGDHCSTYNDIRGCVDMEKSGVAVNKCFWHGFSQHDIYAMEEDYHLYFTDTGEGISCKGAYLTASSLNLGEAIRYNTEGQDAGNLNTYLRSDHQLKNSGYGTWTGVSNDFPDDPKADDYTKNSVCFQLCTDNPSFFMYSEGCDYWHTFNVSPLGATVPEDAKKVGINSAGVQVDSFKDVSIGETLQFDVSQKVEYLGITGAVRYQSVTLVDELPKELSYVDAGVTDDAGNWLNSGQVTIAENNGTVTASLTEDYLKNGMSYTGETYHLKVHAKLNDNVVDRVKFNNQGYSIVNGKKSSVKTVEVSAKEPKLSIQKTAEKNEWRVGEDVTYNIVVNQTVSGAAAKNVVISDVSLPDGLALSSASDAVTVDYPKTWTDISGAKHQTGISTAKTGNGFTVTLDRLYANAPVTLRVKCTATEPVNGKEVVNSAWAKGDNVKTPVEARAKVYINSPGVHIDKECDKEYAKPGDMISYTLSVDNNTIGTLARNVVITDTIETDGLKLQKNSIVLMDKDGNPIEDANITVKGNSFCIETGRKMICPDGNYQILDKEKGDSDGGKLNPEGIIKEEAFTVEYQASATKKIEEGGVLDNKATVTCDEGTKDEDEAEVPVNGAVLDIRKMSNKSIYQVGETGHYKLTIRETRESLTAQAVTVTDAFAAEGMTIDESSIKAELNGEAFEPESVVLNDTRNGFTVTTGKDLTDSDKLIISYDVSFDAVTPGESYVNTATAKGKNTKEVKDRNEILADNGETPKLVIDKKVEKEQVKVGETDKYEIKVQEENHYVTAKNVVIRDSFDKDGAAYIRDTLKILDKKGNDITSDVLIQYEKNGFTIETRKDLGWNEFFTVTYEMEYTDVSLANQTLMNKASAVADNADEVVAAAKIQITPDAPELSVKKEATAKELHVGDTNIYTIKVMETKEGETARNVVIGDSFAQDGAEYVQDSLKVTDQNGETVPGMMAVFEKDSFYIKTGRNLSYNQYLLVTYQVKYTVLPDGGKITNTATSYADNADKKKDQSTVSVLQNAPELSVTKTAERTEVRAGETNTYTITVKQTKEGATAKKIVIRDTLDAGGSYVKTSFRLADQDGNKVNGVKGIFTGNNGFRIKVGQELSYGKTYVLTYQVTYAESMAGGSVKNTVVVKADQTDEKSAEQVVAVKAADTTKKSSAPQTGLHDHIRIYAILGAGFIAAGIGFAVYFYRKRKKK